MTANNDWNLNSLHSLVHPTDICRILSIRLALHLEDRYIWAYNHNGIYSVKSGYWLSRSDINTSGTTLLPYSTDELKSRIWRIRTTPKVKLFIWRALSGALAVSDRLLARTISVDPTCQVCGSHRETISHVLFTCSTARQILALANIPTLMTGFSSCLFTNFRFLLHQMDSFLILDQTRNAIPWVLWFIWKNHNNILYRAEHEDLMIVAQKSISASEEWLSAQTLSTSNQSPHLLDITSTEHTRWTKPPLRIIKCNIKVLWKTLSSPSGSACIAHNSSGQILYHARDFFPSDSTKIEAELNDFLHTMQSLVHLNLKEVLFEIDSKLGISAIQNPKDWHRFRNCLDQISAVSSSFDQVAFIFASKSANKLAFKLASSVINECRFRPYLSRGGPSWLHSLANLEAT